MDVIHKYEIDAHGGKIELPKGAMVLSTGVQNDKFFIWVITTLTAMQTELRRFKAYATGEVMDDANREFIGTVFVSSLVFHIFEIKGDI